jgi:ribonuclease-3
MAVRDALQALRHPLVSGAANEDRRQEAGAALGVRFREPALLEQALTHSSAAGRGRTSNQRLEFLGDRVLGLVIADRLLEAYPDEEEGALALRLAALVSADSLAAVARVLDLGRFVLLAPGEEAGGGRANPANLADACEAVIGALYLDAGFDAARAAHAFVAKHWRALIAAQLEPPKDAKTALQEWTQARGLGLPSYRLVASEGPDHRPLFRVAVEVRDHGGEEAAGAGKREAERLAAERMLTRLAGGDG